MAEVRDPLFISSRLKAALKIEGAGTIHISADRRDPEDYRVIYAYVIEDQDGNILLEGADLRSGCGDEIDYSEAMGSLLSFLEAAAEAVEYEMRASRHSDYFATENGELFPPAVMQWAYQNSTEISSARLDLSPEED